MRQRRARQARVQARSEGHVHLERDPLHSEPSTNLSTGAFRADFKVDPRDALEITERVFAELWMLAREHAPRMGEAAQTRRLE